MQRHGVTLVLARMFLLPRLRHISPITKPFGLLHLIFICTFIKSNPPLTAILQLINELINFTPS